MARQLDMFLGGAVDERGVLAGVTGCAYPVADELVSRYGSLSDVVTAAEKDDDGIPGKLRPQLAAMRAAVQVLARAWVINREVLTSWSQVLEYCRVQLAHLAREEFHVLFLDKKNCLIAAECQQRGTVDHTPVYPREVMKRALELDASAIIMVHNHPSGDPTPSRADIEMTRQIQQVGKGLGISLYDHLVIGRTGHTSFREKGLI